MALEKPSPEVAAILKEALSGAGATRCEMFGCLCYSLGGNLFAGVFGDRVFLRLSDADRAAVVSEGGCPFEPLEGRTLGMYVVMPEATVVDQEALSSWLRRSMDLVERLPKRPRKRSRVSRKPGRKDAGR